MEQEQEKSVEQSLDTKELHKILRQLKILNFWIAMFGVTILATLVIFGFLFYKLVTFVQSTEQKLTNIQQTTTETLDVKAQICKSSLFENSQECKQ